MTPRRFLLASVFIWCTAVVVTPLLASHAGTWATMSSLSYKFFSRVCHQLDSHSFHIAGFKFAVCIRCTCIYASFFLGLILFPMIKRTTIARVHPARALILSLVPMGIDVALATLGIHESTRTTRSITGLIFGLALSIVLVPVLEEFTERFLSFMHTLVITLRQLNLRNLQSAPNLPNLSNQPRIHHATETR